MVKKLVKYSILGIIWGIRFVYYLFGMTCFWLCFWDFGSGELWQMELFAILVVFGIIIHLDLIIVNAKDKEKQRN